MLDVTYTWGYQDTREKLRDLYDKAVRGQWISDDVLPWKTDVDLDKPIGPEQLMPLFGSDIYNKHDREGEDADQHRDVRVDALAVPPRRAGRAARDRAARRLGARPRQQAVRGEPGRRRGAPRRRLQPLPPHEDRLLVPGQPAPEDAARHDPHRQPLGHEVPRHADHGRGPRARGVRHDPQQHAGAAAQASSPRT